MAERSVVIVGLPASGKTTYLAALWHLITGREVQTAFRFGGLRKGNWAHLNAIAARWRRAVVQERTSASGTRMVSMNLIDVEGHDLNLTFPDMPGEAYARIWEARDCGADMAGMLMEGHILLFVHADAIRAPRWTVDEVTLAAAMGAGGPDGQIEEWRPEVAPTQVQVVDLLQLLRREPLDVGPRRLAVMLSAWDRVRDEGLTPEEYLRGKLPLLDQYLRCGADSWVHCVYGVSAQGGEYDSVEGTDARQEDASRLRELNMPSTRIQLVGPRGETNDLTEPLAWLMA